MRLVASDDKREASKPGNSEQKWFRLSVDEVVEALAVDPDEGLSSSEAGRRLARHGPNRLQPARTVPWWRVLRGQFLNIIALLLGVAAAICFFIGDILEGFSILVVLVFNGAIGFFTEYKANKALEALQNMGTPETIVLRDGRKMNLPAADVVPGDVVILEEGQSVPADGRVIESAELQVDESSLTGESIPVHKQDVALSDPKTPLAERNSMVYRGTTVTSGNGRFVAVATGTATELGRVSELLGRVEDEKTPLEVRLERVVRKLILVCLGVAVVFAVSGILQKEDAWLMIEAGIALAIAAIPEGLPAVTTITLALGMKRMLARNALIRRLPAVETLGSVTCVCTDKTGTLTRSEMTLRHLVLPERDIDITGGGYVPTGGFRAGEDAVDATLDVQLKCALTIGVLCNNASLHRSEQGEWEITGDPTEAALLVAAGKGGLDAATLHDRHPRDREHPFSSRTMMMGTLNGRLDGELSPGDGSVLCVKGSPLPVLEQCTQLLTSRGNAELTAAARTKLMRRNEQMAAEGMRVLGLAFRPFPPGADDAGEVLGELTWVAFAGIIDPPREEATRTVDVLTRAGIHTVMITGDQPPTAQTIAAEMHIAPPGGPVLSGSELELLDDAELDERLRDTEVFARVSPEQKLRILEALQRRGEVCAMLGDGVNDAAALKAADIGVAMGIRGTDAAKETADMVLLDDRFSTIGEAVAQGRIIYDNIRKCIAYLFSCNLSEILTMLLASLLGHPLPLLPLQILWLNLVTDVFPALALTAEPGEKEIMSRPPGDPREAVVARAMIWDISAEGVLIALAAIAAFAFGVIVQGYGPDENGVSPAVTMSFLTIAFAQLLQVFNSRKAAGPIRISELFSNVYVIGAIALSGGLMIAAVYVPFLSAVLKTTAPGRVDWLVIAVCSFLPVVAGQIRRRIRRQSKESPPATRVHGAMTER